MTHRAPEPGAPTWWRRLLTLEPAIVKGVVVAVVYVLGLVGLNFADAGERIVAGWTAIFAVLPLIQAWWTRASVTPTARTVAVVDRDGHTVAGPAAPQPDGTPVDLQAADQDHNRTTP